MIIAEEEMPLYFRNALTKELWWQHELDRAGRLEFLEEGKPRHITFEDASFFMKNKNITVLNKSVTDINPSANILSLDDGSHIKYNKCLLAVGSSPKTLDFELPKGISTFNTYKDFLELHNKTIDESVNHITVVGGGLLGSELSCALLLRSFDTKFDVAQVYREPGILRKYFPDYLSDYITSKMKKDGIKVYNNSDIIGIEEIQGGERKYKILLNNNGSIETDYIVLAVGKTPNDILARKANLEIDTKNGGIVANSELMVRSDLYVAGDVASFYDTTLETRRRQEHFEHSQLTGMLAGYNMIGHNKTYGYVPSFWGTLSDAGYEAVGDIDSSLETVGVWLKGDSLEYKDEEANFEHNNQYEKGVVYYMRDKKIVGALLWNLFGKVDQAKKSVIFPREFESPERVATQIFLDEDDDEEKENYDQQ